MNSTSPDELRSQSKREADQVWRELWTRQVHGIERRMCRAFQDGLEVLAPHGLNGAAMPELSALSAGLQRLSGWRIAKVPGLIPVREFFGLLRGRRFPAPDWIRSHSHLAYTPEPDAFHDLFGHLPQLASEDFRNVLLVLAEAAQEASDARLIALERVY